MAAGVHNIVIESGATWREGVTLMEPDGETPTDVTGYEVRMEVRTRAGATEALISISEVAGEDGEVTVGDADGHLSLRITPTGTLKVRGLKKAVYDIFIELPGGDVDKLLKGAVTVDPNVTDPTYD
jgi:hypothetical protein